MDKSKDKPSVRTSGTLIRRLHFDRLQPDGAAIDQAAWNELDAKYGKRICKIALDRGVDPSSVDGLKQDVMVKVLKSIGEYNYQPEKARFRTWLDKIVKHTIIDRIRKLQRQPKIEHRDDDDSGLTATVDRQPAPADRHKVQNIADFEREALRRLREQVSRQEYRIFFLYRCRKKPTKEVMQELGIDNENTIHKVKSRLEPKYQKILAALVKEGRIHKGDD